MSAAPGVPGAYVVTLKRTPTGALTGARIGVSSIDQYLAYLAVIGRAPTTWSSYAYDLAVFCRWLAARVPERPIVDALHALTGSDVFAFVEHELRPSDGRRPLAVGTVYRRVVALAKFFDWAVAGGLVDRNPVPRDRRRSDFGRTVARPAFLRVPTPPNWTRYLLAHKGRRVSTMYCNMAWSPLSAWRTHTRGGASPRCTATASSIASRRARVSPMRTPTAGGTRSPCRRLTAGWTWPPSPPCWGTPRWR